MYTTIDMIIIVPWHINNTWVTVDGDCFLTKGQFFEYFHERGSWKCQINLGVTKTSFTTTHISFYFLHFLSWPKYSVCNLKCIYSLGVPGLLLKSLKLITAPGSVSNEHGSVTRLATSQLKNPCSQLEKSYEKNNYIVTSEYLILAENQHSIFIFHYFNAKLLGKYSQTPVWQ